MSITPIISSAFSANMVKPQNADAGNPQIKALEKKLQQLNQEKKEAAQNHNSDKVRELEKEIQATQTRLEQLKQKEAQKQKTAQEEEQKRQKQEEESNPSNPYGPLQESSLLSNYVNLLV